MHITFTILCTTLILHSKVSLFIINKSVEGYPKSKKKIITTIIIINNNEWHNVQ